jgi:hypothetical protein
MKIRSLIVALALAAPALAVTSTAAEAAPKVTIQTIAGKTIKKDATTTISPKVKRGSQVAIVSKTVTVKKGSSTIVDHKTSARLKAGTYRVTTDVTFKTWQVADNGSRKYSTLREKSKTQSLVIKVKAEVKKKAPEQNHACTLTSSGNCIEGGQFCPKAKYGETGWDAAGRAYVCTGDSDHPHWMLP